MFWEQALSEAEVTQAYAYYEELLVGYTALDADSTMLSPQQQRFFMAPKKQEFFLDAQCYDRTRSLNEFVDDGTAC